MQRGDLVATAEVTTNGNIEVTDLKGHEVRTTVYLTKKKVNKKKVDKIYIWALPKIVR